MTIKLLDDGLINKIAAGEVIERPASIVKELVENSLDAASTRIDVQICGGGIERIEVTDNGTGINSLEVGLALQRHATSKITKENDLFKITSMGFRGEALPSIASVSRFELLTQYGSQTGVRAMLEGGKEQLLTPFPTAQGTKIIVRDVFFNTPARRKFLKSVVSEGLAIHELLARLALSRPDVSISFANEKKLYFKTPGTGKLREAVLAIYGHDYANALWDIDWQGENHSLQGMISKPEVRRANRKNQIFYVNNRLVKSPMLMRALEEGYRGRLLSREYPAAILFITVPQSEVDVNVHPQKTEVRFRDEKTIFRLLSQGVRDRLEQSSSAGGAGSTSGLEPVHQSGHYRQSYQQDSLELPLNYVSESAKPFDFKITLDSFSRPEVQNTGSFSSEREFAVIGQCFDSYILVQKDEKLWMIDQHAAHERIVFNRLLADCSDQPPVQILTLPLAFDLSSAGMELLTQNLTMFSELGLDIEPLGTNTAVIRSALPRFKGSEIEVINEGLEMLEDQHATDLDLKREILAMAACKQAIKAGQALSRPEMVLLVDELLQTHDYFYCPHGRPTILEFNHSELDKRFKRK